MDTLQIQMVDENNAKKAVKALKAKGCVIVNVVQDVVEINTEGLRPGEQFDIIRYLRNQNIKLKG
ncbi:hypothetical protein [Candidatus Venteria ishoeyi]|uniref:Uncharacterized protein n=1 Tax=Candidatus Venteria ishoeyi TaxID=1899563 RepID=A0A1H6F8E2_9GAMM|nr:hypothetical protein [Candidatus Venteria ishoeyi]SEH06390.1 Uncharacterised protein [Candidatus Venteria ishoeyi]